MDRARVEVIVADLAAVAPAMDLVLDAQERAAAQRMPPGRPRSRRVAARAILRTVIADRLGVEASELRLEAGAHGKPRLRGAGELRFNLSHSGDLAVVAIAEGVEVGVDVELAGRRRRGRPVDELAIARRVLDEDVCSRLAALSGEERSRAFLQAWVEYEARVKCAGTGLGARSEERAAADGREIWVTPLQVGDGAFAALAVQGGPAAVGVRGYRPELP